MAYQPSSLLYVTKLKKCFYLHWYLQGWAQCCEREHLWKSPGEPGSEVCCLGTACLWPLHEHRSQSRHHLRGTQVCSACPICLPVTST